MDPFVQGLTCSIASLQQSISVINVYHLFNMGRGLYDLALSCVSIRSCCI